MNCCNYNCRQSRDCPARQPCPKSELDLLDVVRLFRYFRRCGHNKLLSAWKAFDAAYLPYRPSKEVK